MADTVTYVHGQLSQVDEQGNVVVMYPETTVEDVTGVLPISKGGTGATTAPDALAALGAAAEGHTHDVMTGASSSSNGTAGLVPVPEAGSQAKFLRGDGTWASPEDTTYSVATETENGLMSSTDKVKLDGIDEGANKTIVDDVLSDASTNPVQNKVVNAALAGKADSEHTHDATDITSGTLSVDRLPSIPASKISGMIETSNLPSYVDDVIEGYYSDGKLYATNADGVYYDEITGESGKIYVDLTTNKTYRWSGSAFVVISETIALGTTSSTAYRGDYGEIAYTHSQLTTGNPHNVTKSDLGLENVENKSSETIRSELTEENVTTALGYKPAETDTTYSVATTSEDGLMSSTDKVKLDGIDEGANKTIVDVELSDTSTNPVQNKVVNAALAGKADSEHTHTVVNGHTVESDVPADAKFTDTTYSAATTSAPGLMSATDKAKLDTIAENANAYTLPTASNTTLGGVTTTSNVTSTTDLTACPIIEGVPYYKDTNTTNIEISSTKPSTATLWFNTGV